MWHTRRKRIYGLLLVDRYYFSVSSFLFLFSIQFVVGLSLVTRWLTNETPTRLLFHTVSYQHIKFDLDLSWRCIFTLEFTEMAENVSGKICFHFRPILATPYLWQMPYFTKYNFCSTHYLKKYHCYIEFLITILAWIPWRPWSSMYHTMIGMLCIHHLISWRTLETRPTLKTANPSHTGTASTSSWWETQTYKKPT